MEPFKTILFAADFSDNAARAFRAACSLAATGDSRLHVLHVVKPDRVPEEPVGLGQASILSYDSRAGGPADAGLLRQLREDYAPSWPIDVEYHLREGDDAAAEALRMAERIKADLIVVGTHGRTGLSKLLAGSVATAVLRRAQCPVLAVRSLGPTHPPEDVRAILHPTDFSERSEAALRVATLLARGLGARLIILHVAPFNALISDMVVPVDPLPYHKALEAMRQRVDRPGLKYPIEARLRQGDAVEEVLRAADEPGCGLIVMGTHGRTGLARLLLGSVAETVLSQATCPVLAVKAPPDVDSEADATEQPEEHATVEK